MDVSRFLFRDTILRSASCRFSGLRLRIGQFLFRFVHGKIIGEYPIYPGLYVFMVTKSGKHLGVTGGYSAVRDELLDMFWKREKTQTVREGGPAPAKPPGQFIVRQSELEDDLPKSRCFFDGIQVFTLNVLDQPGEQCLLLIQIAKHCGNDGQADDFAGLVPALTGNDLVPVAPASHQDGLKDAVRAYRLGKLFQSIGVKDLAGLPGIGSNLFYRKQVEGQTGRFTGPFNGRSIPDVQYIGINPLHNEPFQKIFDCMCPDFEPIRAGNPCQCCGAARIMLRILSMLQPFSIRRRISRGIRMRRLEMIHSDCTVKRSSSLRFTATAFCFFFWAACTAVPLAAQNPAIQMTSEYQQAQQLLAQSDFEGAVAALQGLLSNSDHADAARVEMGSIRMRQAESEMSQALSHFVDAATNLSEGMKNGGVKGPDSPRILYDLGRIYEERLSDYPKAIDAYSRVVSEYPNFMSIDKVIYHLAFSYERSGKYEDAAKMYREIVEKHQYSSFFREAQKRMKSLAPGTTQAAAAIETQENIADAARSDSQSAQANMDLAAMLAKQGNYAKAVEAYKKVIADATNPDMARDAYRFMANMMDEKQKDYKNAAATLEEMMQKYPDAPGNEQSMYKLGRIYEENLTDYKTRVVDGNVRYRKDLEGARKAIDYYDRLTEKYPDADVSAEAFMRKGDLYRAQLKDNDEAKKQYSEFLKRFPDHGDAEKVRERLNQLESE